RRLEIITIRLVPVAGRENDQRQNVDEKKRRNERLRLLADKRRGESQQGKKDDELYTVTHDIGRELPTQLGKRRPLRRSNRQPREDEHCVEASGADCIIEALPVN